MKHVISPILIDGILRCVKEGGPPAWRTEVIYGGMATEGELTSTTLVETVYGDIQFGVSCVPSVDFAFTWDKQSNPCEIKVFVNGVQQLGVGHDTALYSNPDVLEPPLNPAGTAPALRGGVISYFTLNLEQAPCGSVIRLEATMSNNLDNNNTYIFYEIVGHG